MLPVSVVMISRSLDKSNCDNYLGMAVTNTLSQTYGKILKNKIEMEYSQMEADARFGLRQVDGYPKRSKRTS